MAITVRQVPTALTWRNFREVDALPDVDADDEVAQIRPETDIPQDMDIVRTDSNMLRLGDATIGVRTIRNRTAVLRTAEQTDELLKHEQGHFDLYFLATRAMGRDFEAIEASDPSDLLSQMQEAQSLHHTRAETIDEIYDTETDHHRNRTEQDRWDAAIAEAKRDPTASHILTHPL